MIRLSRKSVRLNFSKPHAHLDLRVQTRIVEKSVGFYYLLLLAAVTRTLQKLARYESLHNWELYFSCRRVPIAAERKTVWTFLR